MSKKKTHDEYVKELTIKNSNIEVIESYVDARTPILHHCKKHDMFWKISPGNALKGKGCSRCRSEKISNSLKKEHLEYVADLLVYNPSVEVVDEYINQNTPIRHRCKIHDYIWSAYPYNVLEGKGCPFCRSDRIKEKLVWSHEDYVSELVIKNSGIEVIEQYVNMNTKIWHRCKIDGTEWQMAPSAILHSGCGCPQCNSKLKTNDQYIAELFEINPNIEAMEPYIDSVTPIWHRCLIDNYQWKAAPSHTLRGTGCPKCKGTLKHTHEEFVLKLGLVNPDIEPVEEYNGGKNKITFRCKIDGYTWEARPDGALDGKGCPKCQETKGEKSVRHWLEEHKIKYVYQKVFNDCKDKNVLPFDFYIPDYNILIEYDGQQHFEPIDFAGRGKEWALRQFKVTQRHDNIKNLYCQLNNIRLLRISYLQDIDKELDNLFHLNTVIFTDRRRTR